MRVIFFILLVLIILLIFSKFKTTESKRQKISLIVAFAMIFLFAFSYNFYQQKSIKMHYKLLQHFNQGKDLICEGVLVNNKRYNFVSGTMTFVAKDNLTKIKGDIKEIKTCKMKP